MSKKEYLINWIREISKIRPELGGFAVCPYAKSAVYEIIETKISDISPVDGFDVVIFVVEDDITLLKMQEWINFYNKKYQDWVFLEDCASYDTYINGVKTNNGKYNLILAQNKEKLHNYRKKLAKTEYYSYWDIDFLREILGNGIETP